MNLNYIVTLMSCLLLSSCLTLKHLEVQPTEPLPFQSIGEVISGTYQGTVKPNSRIAVLWRSRSKSSFYIAGHGTAGHGVWTITLPKSLPEDAVDIYGAGVGRILVLNEGLILRAGRVHRTHFRYRKPTLSIGHAIIWKNHPRVPDQEDLAAARNEFPWPGVTIMRTSTDDCVTTCGRAGCQVTEYGVDDDSNGVLNDDEVKRKAFKCHKLKSWSDAFRSGYGCSVCKQVRPDFYNYVPVSCENFSIDFSQDTDQRCNET